MLDYNELPTKESILQMFVLHEHPKKTHLQMIVNLIIIITFHGIPIVVTKILKDSVIFTTFIVTIFQQQEISLHLHIGALVQAHLSHHHHLAPQA